MFISRHPWTVLAGIFVAVVLSGGLNRLYPRSNGGVRWVERAGHFLGSRPFTVLLTVAFGAFLVWVYVVPQAYYFPRDTGATGDNYLNMAHVLLDSSYSIPQHLLYPWVPGQLIRFTQFLGVLSATDSSFLEKAFWVSSIPTRALIIVAFLGFLGALRVWGCHLSDAILGTFLLAASAGCWLWGCQSNALGMGLAMEILSSAAFLAWCRGQRSGQLALVGIALVACLWAHVGTVYFVIGGILCILFLLFVEMKSEPKTAVWHLCVFNGAVLSMSVIFYYLCGRHVGSLNPKAIYDGMAETQYLGEFGLRLHQIPHLAKDNVVRGVMNLIYWDRKTSFDRILIATQVILLSSLGLSLSWESKKVFHRLFGKECLFFVLTSLATFAGFLLRDAGTHYYVVATVPYIGLLIVLLLHPGVPAADTLQRRVLLVLFVASIIAYSGFSTWNLFKGENLEDNDYYRICRAIASDVPAGQQAVYYGRFESSYRDASIRDYYQAEFSRIDWKADPLNWSDPEKLMRNLTDSLRKGEKVFLSNEVLEVVQHSTGALKSQHFTDEVNLLMPEKSP